MGTRKLLRKIRKGRILVFEIMASKPEQKHDVLIKNITDMQENAIKQLFKARGWTLCIQKSKTVEKYALRDTPAFRISPVLSRDRCPHCFCQPCVTDETNRQQWWPQESRNPNDCNSIPRKDCYRRFWAMMSHRGVWEIEDYVRKKELALQDQDEENVIWQRDIMPDCVLKLVRSWFPNLPKTPYMGHKWANE